MNILHKKKKKTMQEKILKYLEGQFIVLPRAEFIVFRPGHQNT